MTHDVRRVLDHAHGKSGDKLDRANIGLVCHSAADFRHLTRMLTVDRVETYLSGFLGEISVRRFVLPTAWGLNFVVDGALDGGSLSGRRVDRLAKALAGLLLSMPLPTGEHPPPGAPLPGRGKE